MRIRIERLEEEVEEIKSGKKAHVDDDLSVLNYTNSAAAAAPKAAKMQEIMQQETFQRENERIAEEAKQKEAALLKKEAKKKQKKMILANPHVRENPIMIISRNQKNQPWLLS